MRKIQKIFIKILHKFKQMCYNKKVIENTLNQVIKGLNTKKIKGGIHMSGHSKWNNIKTPTLAKNKKWFQRNMSVMKSIKINKNGKILIKIYKNELDFNNNLTHFFLPYRQKYK